MWTWLDVITVSKHFNPESLAGGLLEWAKSPKDLQPASIPPPQPKERSKAHYLQLPLGRTGKHPREGSNPSALEEAVIHDSFLVSWTVLTRTAFLGLTSTNQVYISGRRGRNKPRTGILQGATLFARSPPSRKRPCSSGWSSLPLAGSSDHEPLQLFARSTPYAEHNLSDREGGP